MKMTRRSALRFASAALAYPAVGNTQAGSGAEAGAASAQPSGRLATTAERHVAAGPFEANWASLRSQYQAPDWFRDAKFGIWAHWSAQCVPEQGDWYARRMYMQGDEAYEFHCRTYGHPSKVGFKEIDALWKAEHWDPEALLTLYQTAGARYFMALANHHDNFDTYRSRFHGWNTTRLGPGKDIVGTWAELCRKRGLRWGVSVHSPHAWHWFQTAYGYDAEGPLAGVRYDGFTSTVAEGAGKPWQGLDPQKLYVGPSLVVPAGMHTAQAMRAWHDENDAVWDEFPPCNNPGFVNTWFLRCQDLFDSYDPDLVYFDDTGLPLGQAGLDIAAHYYNTNRQRRGQLEGVIFAKNLVPQHMGAVVLDIERGRSNEILKDPWQTDTCLGDWHYSRKIFEEHRYKSALTVIHTLMDVVSKNGNLLLSVPLKGDGTIDSDERQILQQLAAWIPANGDAIFSTRPFTVNAEGPPDVVPGGGFGEGKAREYTASDVRYTTRAGKLYATVLGWPEDQVVRLKSLGRSAALLPSRVQEVRMVRTHAPLRFTQTAEALTVQVAGQQPNATGFAIEIVPETPLAS